jgi:glycosyltransferase involved in cell wall biosynthesis
MLCRCPFVTTEAVPIAEDGNGGYVCPVDDVDSMAAHVLSLFQMNSGRENLLQTSTDSARTYSLENSQNSFEQILISKFTGDIEKSALKN